MLLSSLPRLEWPAMSPCARPQSIGSINFNVSMTSRPSSPRLWPLYAVNFFMADMQSGIGPFVGVFLQERGWASGLIGTAMPIGNVAGMLVTTPIGGLIDSSHNKRLWVVIPGVSVVLASAIILVSQNFWAVTFSQIAQSLASAAIVPAVTGITLGIAKQKGFNALNGRNQAFNHAGNMVGAALSGYLGYTFGYVAVFMLAAVFGAIACVLMIPAKAIDDRQARGSKEDESKNPPDALSVLLKHKPLLVLALALAIFHLGNAAIVPLYGLAAVAQRQANGPSFVATTVVIAQGVMVVTSLVAMQVAGKRNYWPVILVSFMFLPLRGVLAFFVTGWWGVVPMQVLDGHHHARRRREFESRAGRLDRAADRLRPDVLAARRLRPRVNGAVARVRRACEEVLNPLLLA